MEYRVSTNLRALVFLLLRFSLRTRFFLHFALILATAGLTVYTISHCGSEHGGLVGTMHTLCR